ncbi:glycosyltransferase family 4 protein [Flavobacterium fluviatile]|uniref:glycosyltransferase family 4 protein n=1 Tax=Flavobacterium fluviatile TaxID=1862387 RepID=UPI0013D53596|nr:glycosyltransferase family 4 protein [Flavobacterium fluviatile]
MNLLLIGPFPFPVHGCSIANKVLLEQLNRKEELHVSIIDTNSENVSSKGVGSFSVKKVFAFLKSYKHLSKIKKADVVYTTPGQTFLGIVKYIPFYSLCLKFNIPYIIHVHGNHLGNEFQSLKGFKKNVFKYYIERASAGIVLSESLRSNFEGLLSKEKIFVVENFAEDALFINGTINKCQDKIKILYLSNLMKEKGIVEVLTALKKLKKLRIDFKADIAGKIEDESKEEIKGYLDELKDYVTYHGVVYGKTKEHLLKESNVFILPTYYKMEGQPIALIEAMATGNIIITTNHGGIPDIISEENGFFVEKENYESIFEVLLTLNQNLESKVFNIGSYNIEYAKENFSEAKFVNKILKVVSTVILNV